MNKTTLTLIAMATLVFSIVLVAQQQAASQAKPAAAPEANPTILAKLQEIVAIRERQFKTYELMLKTGRASPADSAEIDLVEARIRLARERHQSDAVVAELKNLVAAHERRFTKIQAYARDRGTSADIDRMKVDLLDAEIRLLREQN